MSSTAIRVDNAYRALIGALKAAEADPDAHPGLCSTLKAARAQLDAAIKLAPKRV